MTVKGKRAQALRKMSSEEARKFQYGGMMDESVPPEALALVASYVDVAEFEIFFAPRVGRYRLMTEQKLPSATEELSLLTEAMEAIEQVRTRLENLPSMAGAIADQICWQHRDELFFDFARKLDADLGDAHKLLLATRQEVELRKGRSGAPPASARDFLLCDVAHWLQERNMPKESAAGVAATVLRACSIDVPDDPRKARDLVRKIEAPRIQRN